MEFRNNTSRRFADHVWFFIVVGYLKIHQLKPWWFDDLSLRFGGERTGRTSCKVVVESRRETLQNKFGCQRHGDDDASAILYSRDSSPSLSSVNRFFLTLFLSRFLSEFVHRELSQGLFYIRQSSDRQCDVLLTILCPSLRFSGSKRLHW